MDVDKYFSKYSQMYKSRQSVNCKEKQKQFVENRRKEQRQNTANSMRKIDKNDDEPTEIVLEDETTENIPPESISERRLRLIRWKKHKEDTLNKNKLHVKKPFVVGIVHHKIYSPPISSELKKPHTYTKSLTQRLKTTEPCKTRAQLKKETASVGTVQTKLNFPFTNKNLKPSGVFKFKAIHGSSTKNLTKPMSPIFMRREAAKKLKLQQFMKNMDDKKLSSDEELAQPLSPPVRVTRNRNIFKGPEKVGMLKQPEQNVVRTAVNRFTKNDKNKNEQLSSNKKLSPSSSQPQQITRNVNNKENKGKVLQTGQKLIKSEINKQPDEEDPPFTSFFLSPNVTVERGKRSQRIGAVKPQRQKISLRDKPEPDEPADGPTFQKVRLNTESARLLTLAEDWEKLARLENLNQDIIDDIDQVVGQTRLLTNDKFNQFRSLIEQHEAQHESNKVTLDDLNGFWEMMYLQVVNLDKKYNRLETLKLSNWVEPEPEAEPAVKKKIVRTKAKKTITITHPRTSIRDVIKGKKLISKPVNLIKEELTATVNKQRSSILKNSPFALNALQMSYTAKEYGKSPIINVNFNDVTTTPKSCLKIKSKESSVKKTVLFDDKFQMQVENQNKKSPRNLKRNSVSECNFLTPRRSVRLANKNGFNSVPEKKKSFTSL